MEKQQGHPLTDFVCNLQEKSPSMRRRAIKDISNWLQKQNNTIISQTFDTQLSVPITNLILDHSESVREAALQLLLEISDTIGTSLNMDYMKIFLTVIWEQLGCHESMSSMMEFKNDNCDDFKTINSKEPSTHKQESSEEIRILIVELLTKITTNNYNNFTLFFQQNDKKYCFQYLNVLHLLFSDKCPQIRTKISQLLLKQIDFFEYEKSTNNGDTQNKENKLLKCIFDDYAEYLCLPIAKGCMHQRGRIRLISFELLSKIIENIIITKHTIPLWLTDEQKIWKYISYLTFDQMQYIKKALSSGAFKWISILITAKNNNNSVQCAKIWMLLLNEYGLNMLNQQDQFNTQNELLQCLSFIITLCSQKINHWQSNHRLFGINALVSLTLCLKSKLPSEYVVNLLPNFTSLIACQNDEIVTQTNKCLNLFGTFIPIKYYSDFLFSQFNDSISINAYLKLSAQIFTGYNDDNANDEQLLKICKSLSNSAFLQNNKDDISIQLLNVTINLLLTYNKDEKNLNSESVLEILWLILQTHAGYLQNHNNSLSSLSVPNSERLYDQISNVISLLTKHKNNEDNTESKSDELSIWPAHFNSLYERIDFDSTKANTYYLFGALVYYSKEFISEYMSLILPVFKECNNETNTETTRYNILSILHSLLTDTINSNVWKTYTQNVAFEILLPNIVWKCGKFRLNMRSLSLECMLKLYKNNNMDSNITWNYRQKLISILKSRLDDCEYFIRSVTVELFDYILQDLCLTAKNNSDEIINKTELESMCQSILDRFDDSKDEIRILTCSTLQSLIECMGKQNMNLYANIIETSLIHLDDSNDKLQQKIFSFLKKVSSFNKTIFQTKLTSVNTDNMQPESQKMIQQLAKELKDY